MDREWFVTFDGTKLSLAIWDIKTPVGIIQIIHGMNEHIARYDEFAKACNARGYIVVGNDLRGHGLTAGSREKVGKADYDIFSKTLEDEINITSYITEKYKLPIIILGHSYGSFLTQKYIQVEKAVNVKAFILSGSGKIDSLSVKMGRLISGLGKKNSAAKIIAKMTFGAYDKKIKQGKNAWLTHDDKIVAAYNNDEYIISAFSYGFYRSFFKGLDGLYRKQFEKMDAQTNILILSGSNDAMGAFGKFPRLLNKAYQKIGLKKVELKIYEGMRHEILNEFGKEKVYNDILTYCGRILNA